MTTPTPFNVIFRRLVLQQIRYYALGHDFETLRSDIADKIVADLREAGLLTDKPQLCPDCGETARKLGLTEDERLAAIQPADPLPGQEALL